MNISIQTSHRSAHRIDIVTEDLVTEATERLKEGYLLLGPRTAGPSSQPRPLYTKRTATYDAGEHVSDMPSILFPLSIQSLARCSDAFHGPLDTNLSSGIGLSREVAPGGDGCCSLCTARPGCSDFRFQNARCYLKVGAAAGAESWQAVDAPSPPSSPPAPPPSPRVPPPISPPQPPGSSRPPLFPPGRSPPPHPHLRPSHPPDALAVKLERPVRAVQAPIVWQGSSSQSAVDYQATQYKLLAMWVLAMTAIGCLCGISRRAKTAPACSRAPLPSAGASESVPLGPKRESAYTPASTLDATEESNEPTALQLANDMQSSPLLRHISVGLLVFQISGFYLLVQHTKTMPGEPYDHLVVVLFIELTKVVTCTVMIARESVRLAGSVSEAANDGFGIFEFLTNKHQREVTLKLAIPAACYALQNNLTFVAIAHLGATVAQVVIQTKTLSTAAFSIVLIGRRFSLSDWASFFLLVVGVGVVLSSESHPPSEHVEDVAHNLGSFTTGVAAASSVAILSGVAGVYLELMFTKAGNSLWVRNLQLCCYTVPLQLCALGYDRVGSPNPPSLLRGFYTSTIFVILFQAFGGILISMVIKYAGNMPKTFAAAVSLVITSLISFFFMGHGLDPTFWLGMLLVVISTLIYEAKSSIRALLKSVTRFTFEDDVVERSDTMTTSTAEAQEAERQLRLHLGLQPAADVEDDAWLPVYDVVLRRILSTPDLTALSDSEVRSGPLHFTEAGSTSPEPEPVHCAARPERFLGAKRRGYPGRPRARS